MKRSIRLLVLFGLVVAGGFLPGSSVHAASAPSQTQRALHALLQAAHSRPSVLSGAIARSVRPQHTAHVRAIHEADSAAPAQLSAGDLAVPVSAFSGATITQNGAITPSSSPLAVLHSKGYAGAVGAYLEVGGATLTTGTVDMLMSYQGTLYTDSTAAAASYQDLLTLAKAGTEVPADCSSTYNGHSCFLVAVATTTQEWGPTVAVLAGGQVNQCTVETLVAVNATLVQANQNKITAASAALFDAGMKNAEAVCTGAGGTPGPSPTPTPTPPTTLAGVVVVPNGAQDTSTVLTHAKKGTKVEIVVGVLDAKQGDQASITLVVKRAGKTLANRTGSDTFSASGTIALVATYTLPKKAGPIKITAKLTVDGSTQQKSTKFKVTKT